MAVLRKVRQPNGRDVLIVVLRSGEEVKLTSAELTLIEDLAEGITIDQQAQVRSLSRHTFANRLYKVKRKLKARTSPHLIAIAYQMGILSIESEDEDEDR